jgi:hypothetical protein
MAESTQRYLFLNGTVCRYPSNNQHFPYFFHKQKNLGHLFQLENKIRDYANMSADLRDSTRIKHW